MNNLVDDRGSSPVHAREKANLRLALILLSVVLVFLLGFVGKMVLLGS